MLLSKVTCIAFQGAHFTFLSVFAFPGNRTHDLVVASGIKNLQESFTNLHFLEKCIRFNHELFSVCHMTLTCELPGVFVCVCEMTSTALCKLSVGVMSLFTLSVSHALME